ncbi:MULTISPECIES: MerR family transcriptional regulator [Brevibacillus]|uniref:MerR family transcriptional regulator n=1 Tax=Brevibacillus TaxID=55080 RepID=UPI001304EAEA|nr:MULTISPECIES: MerR family transcriptional regulator [Brevibacillus]MED1948965.1 MerR family transcriptional regulator [Brevibacillus formosus]MED2001758.1 MerR family transcriptional regulator [Brevibacillus formosus]MED2084593.1 MerR family transcriptional regulator [Brevibacillus formosus]
MPNKLLTIAEIAKQLDIPESTVRFYRDRFEMFVPSVGEGRKKRYLPEAAEVLRFIADSFKRNETATEIEEALSRAFPRTIEFRDETAVTTAAAQQQSVFIPSEQLNMLIAHLATSMQTMADQKQEIAELRKQIASIQNEQEQQLQRSQKLDEAMTSILSVRKEIAAIRERENLPWWKKLFGK